MTSSSLFAIITLVFSSCSSEDDSLLIENQQKSLLKTYKIKRDATGAYSIDFDVTDNTKVDNLLNVKNNFNEYILSPSNTVTEKNISQDLLINNNQLKVGFVDANFDKKAVISVIDDELSLHRKGNNSKLADYSVQSNEDGTFTLDFNVNSNVNVSFVFNESINTHEIHLEEGKGGENTFSRTLEKENGEPLKIVFVNYYNNSTSAKSKTAVAQKGSIRRPELIII